MTRDEIIEMLMEEHGEQRAAVTLVLGQLQTPERVAEYVIALRGADTRAEMRSIARRFLDEVPD